MNYTKAQKEVFDALCSGKRTVRFDIDGNNILVSPDGFRAYIFPKSIICFGLEKIAELKQFPVKELIQDQYQLTLTPDLRIIDAHRTARRLKGDGKNVLVNVKFLSCFQNPRFYQAENPVSGIVVTEPVYRGRGEIEEIPVGYLLPIRSNEVQGDYYSYADSLKEEDVNARKQQTEGRTV